MEKSELIKAISKRANINPEQAELALDQTIVDLISPKIFPKTGEEVGFINDNNCKNNCKDALIPDQMRTQWR
ncbi:MAG: hypothetical protein KKC20_06525 [Proteobacteria bacterium]|nr:hypothetical protein [Pseudomonadota bacterium]